MKIIEGGVCAAKGFKANGIRCGIRKNRDKRDLSLILSEVPGSCAAVYTTNLVKGAPIAVTKKHIKDGIAQAIICNSGNANTCNPNGEEVAVQTAELLQDTAYLLRYTLDMSDRCVTLFQEVEALEKYVGLQEQRFGSRIEFYFDLDESFHDVRVPNLILQPLVENAISHGLGMCTEGGKIRIRTFREKEKGCLSVSDNGSGMDHETLEALIRSIRQKEVRGNQIGLHNVYHRLMIFFSDNASLTITSRKGEGTEVVIRIPLDDDTKQKKENG